MIFAMSWITLLQKKTYHLDVSFNCNQYFSERSLIYNYSNLKILFLRAGDPENRILKCEWYIHLFRFLDPAGSSVLKKEF
jgi:hypothetical protein